MKSRQQQAKKKGILSTAITTYIDGSTDTGKVKLMGSKYPAAKKIAWKINFASGMQSHKIGSVNSYTDLARACNVISDSDPRLSIYQIPCVGFQELSDGTMKFIGLYTIGPDKSDKSVFLPQRLLPYFYPDDEQPQLVGFFDHGGAVDD